VKNPNKIHCTLAWLGHGSERKSIHIVSFVTRSNNDTIPNTKKLFACIDALQFTTLKVDARISAHVMQCEEVSYTITFI